MFVNSIKLDKTTKSSTRKLPFLPRIGLSVDIAGYQLNIKAAPFSETIMSLKEKGLSLKSLKNIAIQQLNEIKIPFFSSSNQAAAQQPEAKKKH